MDRGLFLCGLLCKIITFCSSLVAELSCGWRDWLHLFFSSLLNLLSQIFEDGINEPAADCRIVSPWSVNRKYLLSPINGVLKYDRLGNQERNNPEIPFEKASLVLSDVFLTMTEVWSVFYFIFWLPTYF